MKRGDMTITPSLGASVSHVERDGYTDTAGTAVPGSTITSGNLNLGASVSQTFDGEGRVISYTPSLGLSGVYNFSSDEALTLVNGGTGSENGFGAILTGGLDFNFDGGRTAGVNGSFGLLEDDVTTWSIGGKISIPLN